MATIEQYESLTEAWERLSDLCAQVACNPSVKADTVNLFHQMAESFRPIIEDIGPRYYQANAKSVVGMTSNLVELGDCVIKVMKWHEKEAEG